MSLRGTKQSHAIQNGFASVRLPRYPRNDIVLCIIYLIKNKPVIARNEAIPNYAGLTMTKENYTLHEKKSTISHTIWLAFMDSLATYSLYYVFTFHWLCAYAAGH